MNTFTQTDVQPQHAGGGGHADMMYERVFAEATRTNFVSRLARVGPSVPSFCRMVHLFGKWANAVR